MDGIFKNVVNGMSASLKEYIAPVAKASAAMGIVAVALTSGNVFAQDWQRAMELQRQGNALSSLANIINPGSQLTGQVANVIAGAASNQGTAAAVQAAGAAMQILTPNVIPDALGRSQNQQPRQVNNGGYYSGQPQQVIYGQQNVPQVPNNANFIQAQQQVHASNQVWASSNSWGGPQQKAEQAYGHLVKAGEHAYIAQNMERIDIRQSQVLMQASTTEAFQKGWNGAAAAMSNAYKPANQQVTYGNGFQPN